MGLIFILTAALAVQSSDVQIGTVSGKTESGLLQQLSSAGATLATGSGTVQIPQDQLLFIAPKQTANASAEKHTVWIELIDGSKLSAVSLTIQNGTATISMGAGGTETTTLPAKILRRVRFTAPNDPQARV